MKRLGSLLLLAWLLVAAVPALAENDPKAVIDNAIAAIGGEDAINAAAGFSWKTQGKIIINGMESEFTGESLAKDLDHLSATFNGSFQGNMFQVKTVVAGDQGWRSFSGNNMPIEGDALANEKRNIYLQLGPAFLVPLKGEGFELADAGEQNVGDKPAIAIKVTGPDDKDFMIYFDKETGLPVRQTATVTGFMGEEFEQETTFGDYKEMDGIKKATKIEQKRDGTTFLVQEVTDFKVLKEIPADAFAEPE